MLDERPATSPTASDSDVITRPRFDITMSPERWFARYAHTLQVNDAFDVRTADPELADWIAQVKQLAHRSRNYPSLDFFRRRYLTYNEIQQLRAELS